MTTRTPAQLATEMQALQEHIDAFNKDVGAELLRLNLQRHGLMNKGAELGFSRRHMHEWLARVPKGEEVEPAVMDGAVVGQRANPNPGSYTITYAGSGGDGAGPPGSPDGLDIPAILKRG